MVVPLIGGAATGLETNLSPLQGVAQLYNQFVFQASVIKYIPSVGLNTSGNVTASYITNVETMAYILDPARTYSEIRGVCISQANAVSHPIWQEFSYAMSGVPRKKRFDTNRTNPITDTNIVDRDCQGVFIVVISGGPVSSLVSTPRRESRILLEGLTTTAA
jgi:hypothetical protein